jgi:protein-tyrosine phosphatase
VERAITMRSNVFWIEGRWRGRLAICLRPRGGDWLDAETRAWREAGIDVVVSLLEPSEEEELDLGREAAVATDSGLEFLSFPIPDRGIPRTMETAAELITRLTNALRVGKNVAVHCRQSIGRSAMITAATLIAGGQDVDTALNTIARARGYEVPETHEQRQWIAEFAGWFTNLDQPRDDR